MKTKAIYIKEWFKLKRYVFTLVVINILVVGYFYFDLSGQYANIEPETMMWYRFSHLGYKPYAWLDYYFILVGAIVAICQFVPEAMGKKVRILTHIPIPLSQVVFSHLFAGGAIILFVNAILALGVVWGMSSYYPWEISQVTAKDMFFSQFPTLALYLGLAAVIIESDWKRKALKLTLALLLTFVLTKDHYQMLDLVWVLALAWLVLPVTDSFLSVKTRRIENKVFSISVPIFALVLAMLGGTRMYNTYAVSHVKYYVFYSPVIKDFVYQRNDPGHKFAYGTKNKALTKTEFQRALPFVFWKNLDIQGKLPVIVDGKSFNKSEIRGSRMSLQYDPSRLEKPEVALYPFFNPISHKGSISFPEEEIALKSDSVVLYNAETARETQPLTQEVNKLLENAKVEFPIRGMWGKTTNMKPFDWGYFIKDSANNIFNLARADDKVRLSTVNVPKDIGEIAYIQVSENRKKQFYGYAISKQSKVYLISYPDYRFIPIELDGFDYKSMTFQLLADPLSYLVRYSDGNEYKAIRFDKAYQKQGSVVFK